MAEREDEPSTWTCNTCGNMGFDDGGDGFFYCLQCGSQADDIIDTGVADEEFVDKTGDARGAIYLASHRRQRHAPVIKAEPISQSQGAHFNSQLWHSLSQNLDHEIVKKEEMEEDDEFMDGIGPTGPSDFGSGSGNERGPSFEDYYNEVRMRYVMGLQLMIELQCEALMEKFGANSLISGFAGVFWLRYVAMTRVFDDGWADDAVQESELQKPGDAKPFRPRAKYSTEPHNLHGQRAVTIWYRSLRRKIPLSISLAVCFLACHVGSEAILPTDIVKWALEGRLPYFAAYTEIEKHIGAPSSACPLSSNFMFRPCEIFPVQKLEAMAASVAESIGLSLPPVNFYAIASRLLKQLSLPLNEILPHACHVYEWSAMPPDLWLSANELRLPTRVCVMSILIVTIRIIYNIHGFGFWELSLATSEGSSSSSCQPEKMRFKCDTTIGGESEQISGSYSCKLNAFGEESPRNLSHIQKSESDAAELLNHLEAKYNKIDDADEYSKDLPSYLQYCKDVVFAGVESSFEHYEEEKLINKLWDFYRNQKVECNGATNHKRSRNEETRTEGLYKENKKTREVGSCSPSSGDREGFLHANHCTRSDCEGEGVAVSSAEACGESFKDEAISLLKSDMEENRFCYIPPRVNLKRFDYLHYARKKDRGAMVYVSHADYYVLLRACARAVRVTVRSMHFGVLSLERRLAWLEKRIDYCLQLTPLNLDVSCKLCCDPLPQDGNDDSIGLSRLNL